MMTMPTTTTMAENKRRGGNEHRGERKKHMAQSALVRFTQVGRVGVVVRRTVQVRFPLPAPHKRHLRYHCAFPDENVS